MTRDEAVERAEVLFGYAFEALTGTGVPNVAAVNSSIALGNGYLALARLADD